MPQGTPYGRPGSKYGKSMFNTGNFNAGSGHEYGDYNMNKFAGDTEKPALQGPPISRGPGNQGGQGNHRVVK